MLVARSAEHLVLALLLCCGGLALLHFFQYALLFLLTLFLGSCCFFSALCVELTLLFHLFQALLVLLTLALFIL